MDKPSSQHARDSGPRFSIGDVAAMTQLSEATLRVWERRYHFPEVTRSAGRQRLYTQRAVIQLQWVKLHLDEGMRPGQAILALHQVPLSVAVATTLRAAYSPESVSPAPVPVTDQRFLLERLLAFDSGGATELLQHVEASYSPASVILELIHPTLAAIGEAWRAGDADVATEHFASHYLRHFLLDMIHKTPPPHQVKPVVLACAPGELHEGSLLMLAALLRHVLWPVVYLGPSVPLSDLAMVVGPLEPALIVFVAMALETAEALVDWPAWLTPRVGTQFPLVGYGGRAFTENPALAERVPGVLLGQTLGEGIARIHRLLLDLNALEAS